MHQHLKQEGVDFLQFGFRWINCLLLREIPFGMFPRLWDTYIAENDQVGDFVAYFCAALLMHWSAELKALDFQGIIVFLQSLPTDNWTLVELETILSQAHLWRLVHQDG